MNAMASEHGFSHRSNFCKPKALRVYRCDFDNCKEILNPHGLEKNVKVHFAQQHGNLTEPLLVRVEKGGKKRGRFFIQPKKKGKKDTGKEQGKQQPKAKRQEGEQQPPNPNDFVTDDMEFDNDEDDMTLKHKLLKGKVTDENENATSENEKEKAASQKSSGKKDQEKEKMIQTAGKGGKSAGETKGGAAEQNQENQPVHTNVQYPVPTKRLRGISGPFKQRRRTQDDEPSHGAKIPPFFHVPP